MILNGQAKYLQKPVPVPLCSPQTAHGLACH